MSRTPITLFVAAALLAAGCRVDDRDALQPSDAAVGPDASRSAEPDAGEVATGTALPDALPTDAAPADASPGDASPDAASPDAAEALPRCWGADGVPCPDGYNCYFELNCVEAIPAEQPCDRLAQTERPCIGGTTCLPDQTGAWRCIPDGQEGGYCVSDTQYSARPGSLRSWCAPGLACVRHPEWVVHVCRPGVPHGGFCVDASEWCSSGSWCVHLEGTPRCVPYGTAGGFCGMENTCDAGLECVNASWCQQVVGAGERCDGANVSCALGNTCVARGAERICVAHGTLGADCFEDWSCADAGLQCASRPGASARCVRAVSPGGACSLVEPETVCTEDSVCVPDLAGPDRGTCAPPGAAGTFCPPETGCDDGLECTQLFRYGNLCQSRVVRGGLCDLTGQQTLCPEGTRCLPDPADARVSRCAPVSAEELEPNDAPLDPVADAAAAERTRLVRGALSAGDLRDCHAIVLGEPETALLIEVAFEEVAAGPGLLVSLFGANGDELGRWLARPTWNGPLGDVARLSPARERVVGALPSGEYALCLSTLQADTRYTVGLAQLPPDVARVLVLD